MISILIVDDHEVVRRGLKQSLSEEVRDIVLGEARSAQEALLAVARRGWDLAIVDIGMPDRDGFEILQEMRRQRPEIKVLVLSLHSDPQYAARAMQLGANGYIAKDAALWELLKGVRNVLAGKKYLSRAISEKLASSLPDVRPDGQPLHASLSAREREVLLALADGKGIGEIAAELSLNTHTVSTYKRRTLNKLQLNSVADLVRYAIDHGLLNQGQSSARMQARWSTQESPAAGCNRAPTTRVGLEAGTARRYSFVSRCNATA